jgi:hypothetical protein
MRDDEMSGNGIIIVRRCVFIVHTLRASSQRWYEVLVRKTGFAYQKEGEEVKEEEKRVELGTNTLSPYDERT